MTRLHLAKRLGERELASLYEALFLQSVVAFELMIEDIFLGLVTGQIIHQRPAKPLVTFPNLPAARKIVMRDRYLNWLPYENLKKISEIYFVPDKNPFSGCPIPHTQEMRKAYLIRNYIAHKSEYARHIFETEVVSPILLHPRQKNLLGYFRFIHSKKVNKFEYHIGELLNAARWFCMEDQSAQALSPSEKSQMVSETNE